MLFGISTIKGISEGQAVLTSNYNSLCTFTGPPYTLRFPNQPECQKTANGIHNYPHLSDAACAREAERLRNSSRGPRH
jgi:hypothetical protein